MQVIKGIVFDAATQLVSSNAVETYSPWSSGTTYAKDDFVDYETHIYQSLVNSNTNHQPDTSPTYWIQIGPDNTHAMFDNQVSTQTTSSSPLNVTVNPGAAINSAAFLNLTGADTLTVTMTDGSGGPTVYSNTIDLDDTTLSDWYMYFYEPFNFITDVVLTDLPAYVNCRLIMSLSGPSTVAIGNFIYGTVYDLGGTQYGAGIGIRDYSVKQTDEFGNTTFVERAYSKRMDANIFMDNSKIYANQKLLTSLRATPSVWIGNSDSQYQGTIIFGFYKDFNITIQYPTFSMCSLTIEGLI